MGEARNLFQPRLQVRKRLVIGAAPLGTGFNHLDTELAEGQGSGLAYHFMHSYDTDRHESLRILGQPQMHCIPILIVFIIQ